MAIITYRVIDLLADDIIATFSNSDMDPMKPIVMAFRWEDELINRQAKLEMDGRQARIIDRYKVALSKRLMDSKRFTLLAVDRNAVRDEQAESSSFAENSIDAASELAPGLLLHGKFTVFVYAEKLQLIVQSTCINTKTQAVMYTGEWICTTSRDGIPEFTDLTGNKPANAMSEEPPEAAGGLNPTRNVESQRDMAFIGRWSNGSSFFTLKQDGTWSTGWTTIFGTWDMRGGELRLTPTGPTKAPLIVKTFSATHIMVSRLNESWDLTLQKNQ